MTTTGRTTSCSAKRLIAFGSESRTEVSSTYVRRPSPSGVAVAGSSRCGAVVSTAGSLRRSAPLLLPPASPRVGGAPAGGVGVRAAGREGPDPALPPEQLLHGLASRGRRSPSVTAGRYAGGPTCRARHASAPRGVHPRPDGRSTGARRA